MLKFIFYLCIELVFGLQDLYPEVLVTDCDFSYPPFNKLQEHINKRINKHIFHKNLHNKAILQKYIFPPKFPFNPIDQLPLVIFIITCIFPQPVANNSR